MLRGRPLDHDQWRRRGRGSVFSPVGPAALRALSTQVSRMAAGLATEDLEWPNSPSKDRGSQAQGLQETHDTLLHPSLAKVGRL